LARHDSRQARRCSLQKIAHAIRQSAEVIAGTESRNVGKPISDARDEVALGARIFEYYAGAVTKFGGQTIPVARGGFDFTLRQPMVSSLRSCRGIFRSRSRAGKLRQRSRGKLRRAETGQPIAAERVIVGEGGADAGLPAACCKFIPGAGNEVGDALVQHPLVRKVSFTGSTEIGKRIMELASRDLKRVSLELGGKSPNIVFSDVDLEQAAQTAPMSVFGNCG